MNKAKEVLEKYYGYKEFRKGQEEIIDNIIEGKDLLAIMPTGGGKSICYQIPALILEGITLVISPLISLMKDQVDTIVEMGIGAAYINSSLSENELNEILNGIKDEKYKIVYIAPERLDSYEFLSIITGYNIAQIAIDEAHCVSQWGHDFRTSYRKISSFINSLLKRPIVTAFTATATEEVREDIVRLLGLRDPKVFIAGFDRENLTINILKPESKRNYVFDYVKNNADQSGIIYAATRKEVDYLYEFLQRSGFSVGKYHAGMSNEERISNQEDFIYDRTNLIIATNAFGMGIDKPNIRYVIHYNMPKNIEAYYQEIGRAGRDGEESECILLFSQIDVQTQKYLIEVGTENSERKNVAYKKLQQMIDLVHSNDCYRKYILTYFGETVEQDCGKCSNCNLEGEIIDRTLDAQKVLSCVYRMKRNFGTGMIVDVLRGSKGKKIMDLEFNKLSTYGIMKNYSKDELRDFINTLISHGYINLEEGTFPLVKLNERSISVLKGQEVVKFKQVVSTKNFDISNELYEELRDLRRQLAKESGVPPYMVFGDGTLKEMSTKYPINKEQMMLVSGVGEVKYAKYGETFADLISKYVVDHNININSEAQKQEVKDNSEKVEDEFNVLTDKVLFKSLVELRVKFAKKERVFPQSILAKNTLKEISGRYPINTEQLGDIAGIGPIKIQKYGKEILEEVNKYILENNINVDWKEKKKRKLIIDGDARKDKEKVIDMINEGKTLDEVYEETEVSISTILGYMTEDLIDGKEILVNFNIKDFYTEEEERLIINVCENLGYDKVGAVKKELPDYVKYESIRAVILNKYIKSLS
ncbi:DNA helicase RecQ [Inconstantimicrobium mannanitabidum]|uniref:ATP-dependent DNA helicase RecQ n=1 Tax=Inconstantimicrobium mannanitabidum TaxID=1604901 RepID=A0ACB5RC51_9CLOT|nr:DNA helicase RecQ [Clostridium sp. TW13]GKX66832.1 ATP-dependent DNA helicase RecQ [Clostridium sp. TW13]